MEEEGLKGREGGVSKGEKKGVRREGRRTQKGVQNEGRGGWREEVFDPKVERG